MVLVPLELQGTISAVQAQQGAIIVHDGAQTWALRVVERTEIHIRGGVEADMLKPGSHVRFFAEIDARTGRVRGKVGQLTLITPAKDGDRMLGAFYHQPSAADLPEASAQPPRAEEPEEARKEDGSARPGRTAKNEAQFDRFDVRGQIVSLRGSLLTVNVTTTYFRSPIRVELEEGVRISADLADLGVLKPGDRVSARGVQLVPQTIDLLHLEAMLTDPLTTRPHKKPRPTTAKLPNKPSPAAVQPRERFEVADQIEKERAARQQAEKGENQATSPRADDAPRPHHEAPLADSPSAPRDRPDVIKPEPGPPPPRGEANAEQDKPPIKRTAEQMRDLAAATEAMLGLPVKERILRGGFAGRLSENEAAMFVPSKRIDAEELQKRLGPADRVDTFSAELPIGEDGGAEKVQWTMWSYGSVRVLVDEQKKTRYYSLQSIDVPKETGDH